MELVKKETIRKVVFLLWDKERQVVEEAGAVSIASIMENKGLFMGKEVVAVISGEASKTNCSEAYWLQKLLFFKFTLNYYNSAL